MRNIANIVKIRIIQAFLLRMTTNDPGEAADGKKPIEKLLHVILLLELSQIKTIKNFSFSDNLRRKTKIYIRSKFLFSSIEK